MMDYNQYLKIDTLLSLQEPLTESYAAEQLFIITHQAMELWFKLTLQETQQLVLLFYQETPLIELINCLNRLIHYWKILRNQFEGLSILSPIDFMQFRKALKSASGLQSKQYQAIERVFGLSTHQSAEQQTLKTAVYHYLAHSGMSMQQGVPVHSSLLEYYREDQRIRLLCDTLMHLEAQFAHWKFAHLSLVKRIIGDKTGTAKTARSYLHDKVHRPIFPELYALINTLSVESNGTVTA